jgi:outer membrane protein assembly factor BamB/serine/threonine protein kinase
MFCGKCGAKNPDGHGFCAGCGAALKPVPGDIGDLPTIAPARTSSGMPVLEPGRIVDGRYEVKSFVGAGGMGALYEAFDTKLGRTVAVKLLLPLLEADSVGVERFLKEAKAVAKLNHPNIVTVYEASKCELGHYIVMEFVRGESLAEKIKTSGKLPTDVVLRITGDICHALSYAHKKGIVHRDVKPGNVLVTKDGAAKVVDFGLAKMQTEFELSRTGAAAGTPCYMAPEQRLDAKGADHRADIYALGATMYHMLTGELPSTVRESRIPPGLRGVVLKCMEEDPGDRYFSVDDVLADIGRGVPVAAETAGDIGAEGLCPRCGTQNPSELRFCRKCGAGLLLKCPNCGREDRVGVTHCGKCGANIREAVGECLQKAKDLIAARNYNAALWQLGRCSAAADQAEVESLRAAAEKAIEDGRPSRELQEKFSGLISDAQRMMSSASYSSDDRIGEWEKIEAVVKEAEALKPGDSGAQGLLQRAQAELERERAAIGRELWSGGTDWSFETGGGIHSSPAVFEGKVFVGCNDGHVYCFDVENGCSRWKFDAGDRVVSSPAVVEGRLFVGSLDGRLYCVDTAEGEKAWDFRTGGWVVSSPAVSEGRVFVGSFDGKMYCCDAATGKPVWEFDAGSPVRSSPAVAGGRVVFAGYDRALHCCDVATGRHLWTLETDGRMDASPAVADGRVFIGDDCCWLYCVDAETGKVAWKSLTTAGLHSSPAAADGRVFVGNYDRSVHCFDAAKGKELWKFETRIHMHSSPAVCGGFVFAASGDIYCIAATTGKKVWQFKMDGWMCSSPALSGGKLFVGGDGGRFICLDAREATKTTHWPMFGGGPERGGRQRSVPEA